MTPGKHFLLLSWGMSLGFQIGSTFMEHHQPASLVLCVLTTAIWGLICRLDDLERQIAGCVRGPEPKPELESSEAP
jgi:hypothetical protein